MAEEFRHARLVHPRARICRDGFVGLGAVGFVIHQPAADGDDGGLLWQTAVRQKVVERGQKLAVCQIARSAEYEHEQGLIPVLVADRLH